MPGEKIVCVALDGATGSYDKLYSYTVPKELVSLAKEGCRVTVPFGRGNKNRIGIILSFKEYGETENLKSIVSVIDGQPVLSDEMRKICAWMKENVFCTYFDAVNAMIPAGLKYKLKDYYLKNGDFGDLSVLTEEEKEVLNLIDSKGELPGGKTQFENLQDILFSLIDKGVLTHTVTPKRNLGDFTRKSVRLAEEYECDTEKLTPRQQEVYEAVKVAGEVTVKELEYFTGASVSVINTLVKKGVLTCFDKQEFRIPRRAGITVSKSETVLNSEQETAFLGLKDRMLSEKGETALLYGVTGSGKTQVFLKLADEAIRLGRGVIIMVPEIALTPQMIGVFSSRYGINVAVFHSAMSLGQRMDEYRRIESGRALIAVGTRSAVFAPFKNLGLIVIDEEQEHTYKSEKSPRFNATDIARLRIKYHKGLLCLSSATPSIGSYSRAISGKYGLYKLNKRFNDLALPEVRVVSMRKEMEDGNSSDISRELSGLISKQLERNKQSIILLNRRGHNTYVSCPECGFVATCDNCSISLTYHSANNRLMCHYCGHSVPLYKKCPECGSKYLHFSGAGTQRIAEELSTLFPKARILRLDADSTMSRDSYSLNLGDFAKGKYDIMIGTQMVAKGLDFPNVSLVGVIGADRALSNDDYRGFERTFDLLTQVIGRAGRADGDGIAVIQTSDIDNHIIELAKKQDYEAFYKEEIADRKIKIFPPFCDLCLIWTQSSDEYLAKSCAGEILTSIKKQIKEEYSDLRVIVLGPSAATVPKINGKYRYKMLIKCKNNARFREMINGALKIPAKRDVAVGIDINPESII